ncbi:probable iron/ascorbate oxidoreductase DDB_G0283291 isoform X2 [Mizuhopecten yessoensis]|uniref:Iron/ascorbate oxidoreductase-like protein n=1 Tax=Mizuhopecten yessoensis TaxID=6573 RepID=A0A210QV02_MIZYE|nr:probable iron/ascorbate oxidoreductase DDB_G0283291 isoform X2 [Mizuhopecten yessoensis]OWF52502.1 Iron/ascorbate oxidoreductase-like protein [Mizuhopecten yessoensis]
MTTMTEIPVVDLAPYGLGVVNEDEVDTQTIRSLADSVCGAFRDIGFCYVKNHGVQQSLIDRMKAVSKTFFEKPVEYKKNYARPKTDNHGWVALERESLNPERPGDYKEAFNYSPCADIKILPDIDGFKAVMEDFYASSEALSLRIFDLVSIGLDLGDNKFMRKCHALIGQKGNCTALRSLYYPSLSTNKDIKPNQVRCGEHSDYGSLTLLFQDDVGGLEVRNLHGEYIPASPIPGTILINIGDLMQRWTADQLTATKHRVLIPEEELRRGKSRQSVAFFLQPDDEVMIECLDKSNKYKPISSYDYLQQRFAATY